MTGGGHDLDRAGEGSPPSVSIVVPTHSRPEMLSRLLKSFRHLTYPRSLLELIVVGGHHDHGRGIVEAFGDNVDFAVTYRVVPEDALRSASFKRNEGARSARGTILAFTDDDCVVHSDWITEAVPFFRASDVGGVEGAVEIPRPDRLTIAYRGALRLSTPEGYQTCNVLYRKSVFEDCGGFDLSFPYYLEDTDLAYSVLEHGYRIPFAASAIVIHPVQPFRPLKLLAVAPTAEQIPYLFQKHANSKHKLRASIRPFNRSHYFYLVLYAGVLLLAFVDPLAAAVGLGLGLCILVPAHLAHNFRGLHFTLGEVALTALCQPIVPVLRLLFWLKGLIQVGLAPRKDPRQRAMNAST